MPLSETPTLGGLQLIKNYLEILLINILRDETEKDGKNKIFLPTGGKGGLIEKITDLLEKSVESTLNMEEIASHTNYSKSYIFRTFKKSTGSSVISYFNNLKIEKAKTLLKESKLSVNEISELLKFDTPSYFSKAFKKITGYSPLQYKKIVLQK
jgi:AraC-like DNA-binding protein